MGELDGVGSGEHMSRMADQLGAEGFQLEHSIQGRQEKLVLTGGSGKGVLYGVFHLLRLLASHQPLTGLKVTQRPVNGLRMINQWDNADGSVERGYSGHSIFTKRTVHRKSGSRKRLRPLIGFRGTECHLH